MSIYQALLKKLFSLHRSDQKSLAPMKKALHLLENPHKNFRYVHITGTNGKGSVAYKMAHAFTLSGYKTGLFVSPHLFSYRERISIDGTFISEKEVCRILPHIFSLIKKHHLALSFFEITTLLAFLYFAENNIDIAIMEVGIGARKDATNLIHPLLSIVTTISLDHVNLLGTTKEKIALEKSFIIKRNIPVLLGPKAMEKIFFATAQEKKAPLFIAKRKYGFYDNQNTQIAREGLKILSPLFFLPSKLVEKGISTRLPCRCELFYKNNLPIIFDVAHNEEGLNALFKEVKRRFPEKKIITFFSIGKEKDFSVCSRIVAKNSAFVFLAKDSFAKAISTEDLQKSFAKISYTSYCLEETIISSVKKAQRKAAELSAAFDCVLVICGSFYIMNDAYEALKRRPKCISRYF